MIQFSCPSCKLLIQAQDNQGGGVVACPKCKTQMRVPVVVQPIYVEPVAASSPSAGSPGAAWSEWDHGGWTIFVSACIATLTMFMKWVDLGIISADGFQQRTFLFLGLFAYPIVMLFKNKPVHRVSGIVCGAVGILLGVIYIASKGDDVFDRWVNFAGTGPYIFILACIALIVGIVIHRAPEEPPQVDQSVSQKKPVSQKQPTVNQLEDFVSQIQEHPTVNLLIQRAKLVPLWAWMVAWLAGLFCLVLFCAGILGYLRRDANRRFHNVEIRRR